VHCLANKKAKPSTDVDHIIPHRGDEKLFWDETNWQALCHECHGVKTAKEGRGEEKSSGLTPENRPLNHFFTQATRPEENQPIQQGADA